MTWHEKSPMRRPRLRLAAAVLLASASLRASPMATRITPNRPSAMPDGDRIRLAEAYRLAAAIGDGLWPGWGRVPFATVLVAGENEYFVRHPHPPAGASPLGRDALLGSDVFVRPRSFSPGFLATFPVEGISTVVVGTADATGAKSPTDWVVTLLHEHFHQLQEAQPGFYEKTAALGLARGDTTGMWMLNFPFAYDAAPVQAAYAAAAAALRQALESESEPGSDAAVAAYGSGARRCERRSRKTTAGTWTSSSGRRASLDTRSCASPGGPRSTTDRPPRSRRSPGYDLVRRRRPRARGRDLDGARAAEARRGEARRVLPLRRGGGAAARPDTSVLARALLQRPLHPRPGIREHGVRPK